MYIYIYSQCIRTLTNPIWSWNDLRSPAKGSFKAFPREAHAGRGGPPGTPRHGCVKRKNPKGNIETNLQTVYWLVVSTHLENISQMGNLPQIVVKIKNIWNHHLQYITVFVVISSCVVFFLFFRDITLPFKQTCSKKNHFKTNETSSLGWKKFSPTFCHGRCCPQNVYRQLHGRCCRCRCCDRCDRCDRDVGQEGGWMPGLKMGAKAMWPGNCWVVFFFSPPSGSSPRGRKKTCWLMVGSWGSWDPGVL